MSGISHCSLALQQGAARLPAPSCCPGRRGLQPRSSEEGAVPTSPLPTSPLLFPCLAIPLASHSCPDLGLCSSVAFMQENPEHPQLFSLSW